MTQRRPAFWLVLIVGLLAGSCSSVPSEREDGAAAVDAVATTSTTSPAGRLSADDGAAGRGVLRVGSETATSSSAPADAAEASPDGEAAASGGATTTATTTTTTAPSTTSATDEADEDSTTTSSSTTTSTTAPTTSTTEAPTTTSSTTTVQEPAGGGAGTGYFATVAAGGSLPTGAECAARVRAQSTGQENKPENQTANNRTATLAVNIDGADADWNNRNRPRIGGDFTGATEDILRWGACKWGFDEDITRARAVTESSWSILTEGDGTNDAAACQSLGFTPPCNQSFGLLQVKGSVHTGTYPTTIESTAFGVDYAMAWLRACFEGAMPWLGAGYGAGDEWGCVGAWFSGLWKDAGANDYIATVQGHLSNRTWQQY